MPRYIQYKIQENDWPLKRAVMDCSLYPRARYIDARYKKIRLYPHFVLAALSILA